jgi:VCBS repeat-containing protein
MLRSDGSYSYSPGADAQKLAASATSDDSFTYTIRDSSGQSASAQLVFKLTGVNDAPVAGQLSGTVGEDGAAIVLNPIYSDVDVGDRLVLGIQTGSKVGYAAVRSDGSLTYDPLGRFNWLKAGQTATDSFTYSVKDAAGLMATATVQMTIVGANDAPMAMADLAAVTAGGRLTATTRTGVLGNDKDVEGDTLRVSAIDGFTTAVGKAVRGDFGTLTLKDDGSYIYSANRYAVLPSKGVAEDEFDYTISDGNGGTSAGKLTIHVLQKGQTFIGGTAGSDELYGSSGADVIVGGGDDDRLTGGAGSDVFVFDSRGGKDVVTDFQRGVDTLQFSKTMFADFASLQAKATEVNGSTVISDGAGSLITLDKILLSQLQPADFVFL